MKDARWCMTSSRPSTSQPRSVPALIAAIFTSLTVTLALRGVSLAFTRDEAPVSSAAATGALDSTPSAPIAESGTKTVPAATAEEPAAGIANGAPSLRRCRHFFRGAASGYTGVAPESSQVVNYEANQQMPLNVQRLHSLQEFMKEGGNA